MRSPADSPDARDEQERLRSVATQNAAVIVAARRRAEEEVLLAREALRNSEELLRATFAQAAIGIAVSTLEGRLVEVNRRMSEILGYAEPELKTMTAFDFAHPQDLGNTRADVGRLLAGEIPEYARERRYIRKDGTHIWCLTKVTLLRDEAGRPSRFISAVEDITQRKRAEENERAARAEAERMSELKDQFLATLSHELRTPLSAILGWSQVLLRRPMAREEQLKALEAIERNARMQTQLIEDLLDMSRITSGKLRLDVQPLDPAAFVEVALQTVQPAAEAKGIRLERVLDPLAGPICGDPGRLQQVAWNLLSNAIKFTPKDGRVQVVLRRVSSQVELSVSDTGLGIRPEFLGHVFERFRQADASTTRRQGGLGIGLSIVKQLVELHGGTVQAHSAGEGRGATFIVRLPLAAVQPRQDARVPAHPRGMAAPAAPDYAIADLSGVRVLLVDDERDARELVALVLADCGAQVLSAEGVEQALALAASARPHVLLSDIGMPQADGYELLRRIRALPDAEAAKLPAVALTAFARSEDRTRALRAGFVLHLSKPVEPSELVATVASVLGRTAS